MTEPPAGKPKRPAKKRAAPAEPSDTPTRARTKRKPRTGTRVQSDVTTGRFVSKLTDDVMKTICDSILKGAAPETGCTVAGVSVSTFRQWLADGRAWLDAHGDDEIPIPQAVFTIGVEHALANQKMTLEQRLGQEKDWRAAAHMLERRWPAEWGRKDRIDVHMDADTFRLSSFDLSVLDHHELVQLKAILLKLKSASEGGEVVEMAPRRRELTAGG